MTETTQNAIYEKKQNELYERQIDILDKFLERGAITQAQYDKSYTCLKNTFEKKSG